ncbi:MAG: hypothetical protein ACRDYF_00960 [Acidimicrobiia bacterium]
MIEGIRQGPDEDDESFLNRAERVMKMEENQIRETARALLAAAVRTCDKPETVSAGPDTLRRMLHGPSYTTRRACLLARSLCREMEGAATGSDPVAQSAYRLLTQLALEALRADET